MNVWVWVWACWYRSYTVNNYYIRIYLMFMHCMYVCIWCLCTVCIYARIYVCMYECIMYVCLSGWIYECLYCYEKIRNIWAGVLIRVCSIYTYLRVLFQFLYLASVTQKQMIINVLCVDIRRQIDFASKAIESRLVDLIPWIVGTMDMTPVWW